MHIARGHITFDSKTGRRLGLSPLLGNGYIWSYGTEITFADFEPNYAQLSLLISFILAMQQNSIKVLFPEPEPALLEILLSLGAVEELHVSDTYEDIQVYSC